MDPLQAMTLGVVQGLTEFLPVSSSGHLVIFQRLFGLKEANLFFDVSVHMGTLVAVLIFFQQDIRNILHAFFRLVRSLLQRDIRREDITEDENVRIVFLILIGSVPTALIGLFFHTIADQLFSSVLIVGYTLILTGILLWMTRWVQKPGETILGCTASKSLAIGIMQGLAIIPGISRSGATITVGLFLGLDRPTAARFSFLLSIPAIIGAELLSLRDISASALDVPTLIGTVTAAVVGYGSLSWLLYLIRIGRLHLFAPYCWLVGLAAITWGMFG